MSKDHHGRHQTPLPARRRESHHRRPNDNISADSSLARLKSTSSESVLDIQIRIQCLSSVQPARPITFCASDTIFNTDKPEHGHIDSLALGMLGPGLVCREAQGASSKAISLGYFRVHRARQASDDATDLRDRPEVSFITIPSQDSGEEIILMHTLSAERLFAHAGKLNPEELEIGEKYDLRLREDYVGAMWWCWGGLDDELKDKRLHAFSEGFCLTGYDERPSEEEIQTSSWVTG